MTSPQRFINYPTPHEWVSEDKEHPPDKNPTLRGLPLQVLGYIVAKSPFLQQVLWNNAGFSTIREMPALDGLPARYHPHVIPISDGESTTRFLEFGESLRTPPLGDLVGRYHTVADYHAAYKAKEVTPLQVVEALLPLVRRGQTPPSKYADAWVDFHNGREEAVLAEARASTERWAAGRELGLLDGVPYGVKDEIDVEGWISFCGMPWDKANDYFKPCHETLYPIKRLQESGAVMVGKLTMHELGDDVSGCNTWWKTCTNWHNKAYFPGGSSSGNASALSVGTIPFAVGSDAGGSIRVPSSFSGVYGLKPSHHRILAHVHSMCVVGPMAATAADLAISYRILAQANPEDGIQCQFAPSVPPSPSANKVIGIQRSWFDSADPRVVELCDRAVDHFRTKLGYEVVDITIPYLKELQLAHGAICLTEMAAQHIPRAKTRDVALSMISPQSKTFIGVGLQTPALDFYRYNQLRELLMQHMAFLFRKHPGLLVVTPTSAANGWVKDPSDDAYGVSNGNKTLEVMRYIFLSNMSGCPSVSVPVGYAEPDAGEGPVPVGLMAMGQWAAEEQLLAWAAESEAYLHHAYPDGRRRPDEWVDVLALAKDKGTGGDGYHNKSASSD